MREGEIWLPIRGYEDAYEISNFGDVNSLDRVVIYPDGHPQRVKGTKSIRQTENSCGYMFVRLTRNGNAKNFYVHRLVASHFLGEDKDKLEVNHKDHDKKNNHVDNLEWVTRSENLKLYHKKNGTLKIKNFCPVCEKEIDRISKHCRNHAYLTFGTSKRPSREELINLLKDNSYKEIGDIYKIRTSSVRRWVRYYNIDKKD